MVQLPGRKRGVAIKILFCLQKQKREEKKNWGKKQKIRKHRNNERHGKEVYVSRAAILKTGGFLIGGWSTSRWNNKD